MTVDTKQRNSLRIAVIDNIIENYLYRDSKLVLAFQSKLTEYLDRKSLGPVSKTIWEIIYVLCRGLYSRTDVAASDIYSSIGVSKTAVIRYLNRLESWGIIERRYDSKDKRRKLVKFTNDFELNISAVVDHCADKYDSLIGSKTPQDTEVETLGRQNRLIKFKEFAELSSDWFWETDHSHAFIWFSTQHSSFQEYKPDRELGTKRWDYHAPLTNEERLEMSRHRASLDARKPFRDFIFRVILEDGNEAWCAVSGNPMFDANGTFQGYFGNGRDVTDRRRLIEDLRRSELQLRELNGLAADCSWIVDKDFRFDWYSDGLRSSAKSLGSGLLGTLFWEWVSPKDKIETKRLDELRHRMKSYQPFHNFLGRAVDGPKWNVRWHHSSGVPLYDSDGRFEGYQGVFRDVTNQIRREIISEAKIHILSNLVQGKPHLDQLSYALGILEQVRPGTSVGLYLRSQTGLEHFDGCDKKRISQGSEIMQAIENLGSAIAMETNQAETQLQPKPSQNLFRLSMADTPSASDADIWVNLYSRPTAKHFAVLAIEIEKNAPFGRDIMTMISEVRDLIGLIFDYAPPTDNPQ